MHSRQYTTAETAAFARAMRDKATPAESKLFNAITEALSKTTARIYLQYVIGPYIADMYLPYAQLIIEADGASHAGRSEYDARRETYMRNRGFRTVRFSNIRIFQDAASCVSEVIDACGELKPFTPNEIPITYCPPGTANAFRGRRKNKAWSSTIPRYML